MSECNNCDKYDYKTHSCLIFCDVIRNTIEDTRTDERLKTIEDFVKAITESNKGHWRTTRYEHGESVCETMSYDIGVIKNIAEQMKEGAKATCIDCVRYGDLHSSCALARDMKLDEDSPICESFKGKE